MKKKFEPKKFLKKPISTVRAVIIYVVCIVFITALLVGNYFADLYRELITVYLSGSGSVTTEKSEALCQEIEAEGMVLLKNEENALPLAEHASISLFGQDSVDFVYGGAGSGSVNSSEAPTLKDALEKAGFQVNKTLWDFYNTGAGKGYRKSVPDETGKGAFAVNEVPASVYTEAVKSSFAEYNDAAVVCIGRSGGESADIPTEPLESGYQYLELDNNELDMLTMACENFDTVIVLLNANNAIELGFLEDEAYANVKACVWCGGVGQVGMYAIGDAFAGKTNFSGHLTDTFAYDSLSAPSSANIGDFKIANSSVDHGTEYLVYAENIYVGYRYYETRYEDRVLGQGNAGVYNYASTVQFPFGYGLSYTDFEWSDYSVKETDSGFEVSVTVTNTGSVPGKDVVEIYMQSPYTDYDRENGIEKASVGLVGFAKTGEIPAGEAETVTVMVSREVMKTYDANSAGTYILDAGDYYFTAGRDAHDAVNNILAAKGCTVSDGMDHDGNAEMAYVTTVGSLDTKTYAVSDRTGAAITNQFEDVDIHYYDGEFTYLTRNDWTGTFVESAYKDGVWNAPSSLIKDLEWKRTGDIINDGSEMPDFEKSGHGKTNKVFDAAGLDYDDPAWTELAEKLSLEQAMQLVRLGGYATVQVDSIGLPPTQDKDGPSGISGTLVGGQSAMAYPVEVVMASSWNTDLMYDLGLSIGDDSKNTGVAGWYAPGVNIHRSPYSGRNFEYFSEDGFLSGQMSGSEVKGAREAGVITYMKHFALNDQETNRYGVAVFANEQAIREIFLKGFEYTVDIGNTNAAMASMNRIGATWSGSHKGLMTNVLRDEWGFEGMVITDQASVSSMFYQDIISGLAAGTDLWLNTNKGFWKLDAYTEADGKTKDWTDNATVMNNVQRAAKNVIYAVGTSNAMDAVSASGEVSKALALWEILILILDILVYGGGLIIMVLTTIRLVNTLKSKPKTKTEQAEGEDIVKKKIVVILVVVTLVVGLLIGGFGMKLMGGSAAGGSEISNVYVFGAMTPNSMGDKDYIEYELTMYENGSYKLTQSSASVGYSMLLSNTVVTTYGTYTMGSSTDGYTSCDLSEASRILYNGYSEIGGYNLSYDTDVVKAYPIEMPGGIMTEETDFKAQFGAAMTVRLDDNSTNMMVIDSILEKAAAAAPAEEKAEQAETETVQETETDGTADSGAEASPLEGSIVVIASDDGATQIGLFDDGSYTFYFEEHGVTDAGTYTYDGSVLTLTNAGGTDCVSETAGDALTLHYVTSISDQLTGDYTINPEDLAAIQ